jgi:hypothetical protein
MLIWFQNYSKKYQNLYIRINKKYNLSLDGRIKIVAGYYIVFIIYNNLFFIYFAMLSITQIIAYSDRISSE